MTWFGTFQGSTSELFDGVEGYFALNGVGSVGQIPTVLDAVTSTQVSFRAPNFLGRINFFGENLTVGEVTLPNGTVFPVFTGGTLTGIEFLYNYTLARARDQGISDPSLNLPSLLEPSASLTLPNVPAAALSNAIVQSYTQGSINPFLNFLSADTHVYTGTANANIIAGYNGNDLLIGLAGNDALQGNDGDDTLDGGAGTDALNGAAGSDLYLPGPPDPNTPVGDAISDSGTNPNEIDTVSYINAPSGVAVDLNQQDGDQSAGWAFRAQILGIERVIGSNFNDILYGTDITVSLTNNAVDILEGGFGDDTLFGFSGSDFLQGGPGFDLLIGGPNNSINAPGPGDTARFNASSQDIAVFFQQDGSVLVAAPGGDVDRLVEMEFLGLTDGVFNIGAFQQSQLGLAIGDNDANAINALNFSSLLYGRGGDDTLNGSGQSDTITAADGNDLVDGGDGNDLILGGGNSDVIFGGNGSDTVVGGNGRDEVFLGAGADFFDDNGQGGEAGRDTVNGGGGDDTIQGGNGADQFFGGDGNDLINGRLGFDEIFGGNGFDTIDSGNGADTVTGGNGRDLVFLGQGNDLFNDNGQGGLNGRDTVFGGIGNDTIEGGNGADQFSGNDGFDVINGRLGNDSLFGGNQADTIFGGDGDDLIFGGNGRDRIFMGTGNDRYVDTAQTGDAGQDTITGGAGADTFVFGAVISRDVITDFQRGVDTLELASGLVGGQSAGQVAGAGQVTGQGVLLRFGAGQEILLEGLTSTAGLGGDIDIV